MTLEDEPERWVVWTCEAWFGRCQTHEQKLHSIPKILGFCVHRGLVYCKLTRQNFACFLSRIYQTPAKILRICCKFPLSLLGIWDREDDKSCRLGASTRDGSRC